MSLSKLSSSPTYIEQKTYAVTGCANQMPFGLYAFTTNQAVITQQEGEAEESLKSEAHRELHAPGRPRRDR